MPRATIGPRPRRHSPWPPSPRCSPTSRAKRAITLAQRALTAGREALGDRSDRPWYAHATWFSQTTVSLVVAEDYERVVPLLDESIARARATADSGRFAVGLAHRGWVSLRLGNPMEAAADTGDRAGRR